MSAPETLNNELTETLGYLIDKFNLTLEISSNQIKEFSEQMARKIITWEILESISNILIFAIIATVLYIIIKKFNIQKIKDAFKILNCEEIKRKELEKAYLSITVRAALYFIILALIFTAFTELKDIVLCIAFPEKIILEFMSKYI